MKKPIDSGRRASRVGVLRPLFRCFGRFAEDVPQRRREDAPRQIRHGKAQAVRLARPVVRVLAHDDDLDILQVDGAQRRQRVPGRRVDLVCFLSASTTL